MLPKPAGRGQPGEEEERCSHCGTRHSSAGWWQHPTNGRLCNTCYKYAARNGTLLPTGVLQRRLQQPRGTKEEIAQRCCLECGSASPGPAGNSRWVCNPLTGEEWLCKTCHSRIYLQLKKQRQAQEGEDAEDEEAQEAPAAQQQQQQQQQRRRRREPRASPTAPEPPPKRQRKQASPVREPPPEPQLRQHSEASLPATMLVEGAEEAAGSEGTASASMHGVPLAEGAETAAAAAVPAGVWELTNQGQPQSTRLQQAVRAELLQRRRQATAARQAEGEQPPAPADAGPGLMGMLEQAMDAAAAAAFGLTPELVAAFAALPPLDAHRMRHDAALHVDTVRCSAEFSQVRTWLNPRACAPRLCRRPFCGAGCSTAISQAPPPSLRPPCGPRATCRQPEAAGGRAADGRSTAG